MRIKKSAQTVAIGVFLASVFLLSTSLVAVTATTAPVFSTPVNVSNDSNIAEFPNVQTNGNNVYVVWTERSHGIMFRTYSLSSGTWAPPLASEALRLSPAGTTEYPLMTDSGSYVYVVWSQTTTALKTLQIYFAVSSNGGQSFGTAVDIDQNTALEASTPVIAASGNYVSVAWAENSKSYVSVSSNNGQTWTTPFEYSSLHEPQLAEVGANVYAIADGKAIYVSSNAGSSWTKHTITGCCGAEPWIAAEGNNVLAAWETKGNKSAIEAVYSTNSGATFSKTTTLSTGTTDAWAPMVNISGNSFFIAYRTSPNESTSQEYAVVSTNAGATWSSPVSIGEANRDNAWPFTVASSGSNIYIMWSERINTVKTDNSWQTLVVYSSDDGTTWSSPVSLSTSTTTGAQPEQDIATGAITSVGPTAFAVWQNNQTTSQIYFADN